MCSYCAPSAPCAGESVDLGYIHDLYHPRDDFGFHVRSDTWHAVSHGGPHHGSRVPESSWRRDLDNLLKMYGIFISDFFRHRNLCLFLTPSDFMLSASFLVLIVGAPRQNDKTYQKAAIYISTLVIILLFSGLIKDFKIKNGGERLA